MRPREDVRESGNGYRFRCRAHDHNAVSGAVCEAAVTQHDRQHRRVTAWIAEGQTPVHEKEAVGHSDLRTTTAYTHLAREHLLVAEPKRGSSRTA